MNVRAQIASVFHLDKCIGCHTCSIACKNVWTDRRGAEYMWWNNVETKPGTGYPTRWEDQDRYRGGWERGDDAPRLRMGGRLSTLAKLFYNPALPGMDDYYEPFTFDYAELFQAPEGDDQPVARARSLVTGELMDKIEAGPNWDDDLGGSPVYAANDPNLEELSPEERGALQELERLVFFYLPRICNHCLNPACVAACPSGAIGKRGEDGIVLVNQERCRGWRMCVSACPYKKVYFNWATGKSEKCILCTPRIESGQPPACFHSCVGRIRYLGVLLYDADRIPDVANAAAHELVAAHRGILLDPDDPEVVRAAREAGIPDAVMEAARRSPVDRFVRRWKLALPLHPEFRTLPMLFYVPPLLPALGRVRDGLFDLDTAGGAAPLLSAIEQARVPMLFMASLFSAGNVEEVEAVYRRLSVVRLAARSARVGDVDEAELAAALAAAGLDADTARAIERFTALASYRERFVVPPEMREVAIEARGPVEQHKGACGFGPRLGAERRW